MNIEAKRPVGTASDGLMSQISIGNVLAVHGVLAAQAERMYLLLDCSDWLRDIEAVGGDPVSLDARNSFQLKINNMLDAQWARYRELSEATERLRAAAREYGHTEDMILGELERARGELPPLSPETISGSWYRPVGG
ncbi:hypothetical protein GCM10009613_41740 [Pseudonocardia kongjuensis]|uniref:Excreted virulence factor EspC (Type VII ESX diderm) n=1 Tax=Pseudonocardia kongjuensis TaxID=102227 RepID=A0ABN1Y4L2_9PSEU